MLLQVSQFPPSPMLRPRPGVLVRLGAQMTSIGEGFVLLVLGVRASWFASRFCHGFRTRHVLQLINKICIHGGCVAITVL